MPLQVASTEPDAIGGPSVAARAAARAHALGGPLLERLPRVAAVATLLAVGGTAGVIGGRYLLNMLATSRARPAVVKPVAVRPQPPARPVKATGGLHVKSTPSAQVIVDGKVRGVTPLTIADLSVGRHTIELKSDAGTVERTVTVDANATAEIDESIFSGWVVVYSPFDLVITEAGRTLRLDERNQIMLPPGRHQLRLVNRGLEFDAVRDVEVKPGETLRMSITPPPSTMTVTASEAAEVWLDGVRVGETPLNAAPVELGTHDIVVRRAGVGERRFTVKVTANPLTLNVDFSR